MIIEARLEADIARALGRPVVAFRRAIHGNRSEWSGVVELEGDGNVFLKAADTPVGRELLRAEHAATEMVPRRFRPSIVHWQPGEDATAAILVLDDLSEAIWPPPWPRGGIDRVLELLAAVAGTVADDRLPALELHRSLLQGWRHVLAEPRPFLGLGMRSAAWLDRHAEVLVELESRASLAGDRLVHFDVRSDNLCLLDDHALLVDWGWACRGNPDLDVLAWLPSLRAEGGPNPWVVYPRFDAQLVVMLAGYWASQAGLPAPARAPALRALQRAQLKVALPWMERTLQL